MSADAAGWVYRHSPYSGATFAVHCAIGDSVNEQNHHEFWMAKQTLATKARVATASAKRAVDELVAGGFLELVSESKGRQTSRYRFLFPDCSVAYDTRSARPTGSPRTGSPGVSNRLTDSDQPAHAGDQPAHAGEKSVPIRNEPKRTQVDPKEPNPIIDVAAVFGAWTSSTKRTTRTVLDAKRERLIRSALKTHSLEDVLDAVRGWEHSPWHRGENPERRAYHDLGLLLRDAEHVERFRDFARGPRLVRTASTDSAGVRISTANGAALRTQRSGVLSPEDIFGPEDRN